MILNNTGLMAVKSTDLLFPLLQWDYSRYTPVVVGAFYLMLDEFASFNSACLLPFLGIRWNM